jgi:hypothetical protein
VTRASQAELPEQVLHRTRHAVCARHACQLFHGGGVDVVHGLASNPQPALSTGSKEDQIGVSPVLWLRPRFQYDLDRLDGFWP